MAHEQLARTIDEAFDKRDGVGPTTGGAVRDAVDKALDLLDSGQARVAEKQADGNWQVNQWLKKAVLLSFRLNDMTVISGGPGKAVWWDKVASKFAGWSAARFREAGFRAVPGSVVRRSAYIAPGVVLMPSLRQSRRLCGFRHHDRHLGDGRLLRADRQELSSSPAAPASAACWSRCRPARSSSRTTASSARAPKWPKA